MAEETVALYDLDGRPTGEGVPRSVMRRDNLVHGVVAVLLRDGAGSVYVHRRSDVKDVFPGAHDAFAAGCVQLGESPYDCAVRELAEELGVEGVPLRPLRTMSYADDRTRHVAFVYEAEWSGPVTHQAEEVVWGAWMTPAELLRRLADPDWLFVPDGRALVERLVADGALST